MPSIEWILVAVLACAAAVFAALWMRARGGTSADGGHQLPADTECTLLARGQVDISGARYQYGAISTSGGARPFLINQSMDHLQIGDRFSMRNGQVYKVESRAADASGSGQAADKQSSSAVAPVATAIPATDNQNQSFDDSAQRTVLYIEEEQSALPDLEQAFPFLEVIEGADVGTRFPLPYGEATIGRSEDNVVALADNGASRQHCVVDFSDAEFVVQDLNSTNGTFHNGKEITQPCVLAFGDQIQVSDSVLVFNCDGFLLKDDNADAAVRAFEQCLEQEPDFLQALKNLAFLLERDIRRKKEAEPIWKRISKLEKSR